MQAAVNDFWRLARALLLRTVIHQPQADAAVLSDSVAAHWHLGSYVCKLPRGAFRRLEPSQLVVQLPLADKTFRFRQNAPISCVGASIAQSTVENKIMCAFKQYKRPATIPVLPAPERTHPESRCILHLFT